MKKLLFALCTALMVQATTAQTDEEARELLTLMGAPYTK